MKPQKPILPITLLLLSSLFLLSSCFASTTKSAIVLVGSTPGDSPIKAMLTIPAETKVDFIKWNLELSDDNSFILNIHFGESKPNTMGFKDNGENRVLKGTFSVSQSGSFKVYHLKSTNSSAKILLAKLNENLFHLLTPQSQLMIGNGGWSYSLNRKEPVNSNGISIPSAIFDEKYVQLVFDGRTPCQELASEHPEMNVSQSCFKLKWKLTLNRDSVNYLPTTYTIRKVVDNQPQDVTGKWAIIKGTESNPNVVIYKIEPDKPDEAISLLVADDNILHFLDKNNEPFIGNKDFSFTLNKRIQ